MPPQPLQPNPSSARSHGAHNHVAAPNDGPAAPSSASASSSSSHPSMQERLRRALSRPHSSRGQDLLVMSLRHRSSAQLPAQGSGRLQRQELVRANTAPAGPPQMSPWPLAQQDEEKLNQFKACMAQFYDSLTRARGHRPQGPDGQQTDVYEQACAALRLYQNYLRTRMVQVSEDLREFKERHQDVLGSLFDPEDTKMWKMLNGTEVLLKGVEQNPFKDPCVIDFLAAQMAREDSLDHVIQDKIADIRRSHGDGISNVRCRDLLVLRAHKELVEKDYIQFYLEMTMLSRCQLTAIRESRRLGAYVMARG